MKLPKFDVRRKEFEFQEEPEELQGENIQFDNFDLGGYDDTMMKPELMMTQFPNHFTQTIGINLSHC
jgi:hypothetical protein